MKKSVFSIIAGLVCSMVSFAQHNLGIATSDYSALNSIYLNPANIAGSKEKIAVNLFSINLAVDNNLGTFTNLSNIGSNNTSVLNFPGNNGSFSALLPAVDIHMPGIMVGFNDPFQQSVAFTIRVRAMNEFNNFSQSLYNTVKNNDRSSGQNYSYQTQNFNWTANVWSETCLTYGLVALDDGTNQLKAGVTLKYLGGIDYLSMKGKNLNVNYTTGNDTFYASNSDIEFASNAINADNAYANGINSSSVLSQLFGSKEGGGFGMDIGAVYTYNIGDSKDANSHKLKISAAVTDIGAIKYKEGNNFVANVSGNGYLTGKGLSDNLKDFTDLKNYALQQGFKVDTGNMATKVHIPTTLNFSADYQVYGKVYVNAIFFANLANRNNYGNSYYSQLSVIPRYDSKIFSVGLPITYSMLANDMKLGLGVRVGGFFFGSDDMLALMSSSQHGFDFYVGGYVPLYKKKLKDDSGAK